MDSLSTCKMEVTMENIIYVGADVHKETNSVCMFDWNDGSIYALAIYG